MSKAIEVLDAYDIDCSFNVRSVDGDERIIEGIATTPEIALDGMILEPRGIEFKLPVPFLLGHDISKPLGSVVSATVSDAGIAVRMQVIPAGIDEEVDRTFQKIKHGGIRGLSIRWKTVKESFDRTVNALRITKSKWIELSATAVGVDQGARITHVRSADPALLALLGTQENRQSRRTVAHLPGVPGITTGKSMTNQEHITALENRRAANLTRLEAIRDKSAKESRSMDETESTEFDDLQADVETIDKDLVRYRKLEQQSLATATRVAAAAGTDATTGAAARGARTFSNRVQVSAPNVEKGTGFTRYAIALYFAQGDRERAAQIVESNRVWMDQTPDVVTALRAAVPVGDTTTAGWAKELAPLNNLASEFVELLRPQTLIGRIPGFASAPFNSLIPRQTAGTEGDWTGEGARKPVGRLTVDSIEFKFTKIAKIVVITEELARFSNPSAEARVRQDLIKGIQTRMDRTFVDPAITAIAGIRPASIFNGADTAAAAGTGTIANVITDIKAAMATFIALELPVDQIVILTTPTLAVAASLMRTTLDAPAFPGMTPSGGNLLGFPVYVSSLVPAGHVEFFIPSEVLLADDGQANVDVSNQATIIMDDGGSPSATNSVSLWQENKIAVRAERFVNWLKRRSDSTYYITSANWGG